MLNYKKIKDLRNIILIKKSGLFDYNYYKKENPEASKQAIKHYYYEGYKEGNNPSESFDNDYYLNNNPDVKANNINPLLHYIISGKNEGRRIKKANGVSIPKLYKHFTGEEYNYSISLKNTNKKRISFFLEDNTSDFSFITDMIKNNKEYKYRIIYNNSLDEGFINILKDNKIDINQIDILKYDSNYLLEVYLNEIFICSNYNTLISLINTEYIKKPIYYYFDNKPTDEEIKWLSFFEDNNIIVCLSSKTDKIIKYNLDIKNNDVLPKKNKLNICLYFEKFSFQWFNILQNYFMNNKINIDINIFYHCDDYLKSICLSNEQTVPYIDDYKDMDLIIAIDNKKKIIDTKAKIIEINFKKSDMELQVKKISAFPFNNKQELLSLGNIDLHLFDKVGDDNV
ncbi:MAG: hypothetical protein IKF19_03505 [Bacilli bacterium]|nr:hypothetical protein [Bacilli bacterium]